MLGDRVHHHCPCSDSLPAGKGHRLNKARTGGGAPFQLDQGGSHDHLRPLRDTGQGQPVDFQAAPADEAVSGNQRGSSVMHNPLWMLVP